MKYKVKLDALTIACAIAEYLLRRGKEVEVGSISTYGIHDDTLTWEVEVTDVEPVLNAMVTPVKKS